MSSSAESQEAGSVVPRATGSLQLKSSSRRTFLAYSDDASEKNESESNRALLLIGSLQFTFSHLGSKKRIEKEDIVGLYLEPLFEQYNFVESINGSRTEVPPSRVRKECFDLIAMFCAEIHCALKKEGDAAKTKFFRALDRCFSPNQIESNENDATPIFIKVEGSSLLACFSPRAPYVRILPSCLAAIISPEALVVKLHDALRSNGKRVKFSSGSRGEDQDHSGLDKTGDEVRSIELLAETPPPAKTDCVKACLLNVPWLDAHTKERIEKSIPGHEISIPKAQHLLDHYVKSICLLKRFGGKGSYVSKALSHSGVMLGTFITSTGTRHCVLIDAAKNIISDPDANYGAETRSKKGLKALGIDEFDGLWLVEPVMLSDSTKKKAQRKLGLPFGV